jgi:hypothetical protein
MKNETKVVDPELQLFKERAAMFLIWLVTFISCLLLGLGVYGGLIALAVAVSVMIIYFKKTKKVEVV